jgi:hypothetical protein
LKETGINTQIFRNSLPVGELLYLWDSTSEGDGDRIKVLDEEVLRFKVKFPLTDNTAPYTYVDSCDVKVDRAEVAAVDGTDTLDAAKFYNDMGSNGWHKEGIHDKNNDKANGDDDKCEELGNKVDFMYIAGHCSGANDPTRIYGQSGYGLDIQGQPNNLQTADVGTWDEELEWLVLAACSTCNLNNDRPKRGEEWVGTMDKTHAIFGYRYGAPGGSTPTTDVTIADEFVTALSNSTVKNAWIDTNFAHKNADSSKKYSPLNAVAIVRADNVADTLGQIAYQTITRDSTDDNYTYYWIYWEDQEVAPYVDQDSVEKRNFSYFP